MKYYIALAVIIYAGTCSVTCAQVYENKTVHAGEKLSDYFSYMFPAFSTAEVTFKGGGTMESAMNFNMLICRMVFISPKGDTLDLAKPEKIDSIHLNGFVFFYRDKEGFYQLYPGNGPVKLVVLRNATYEPVKLGALGLASHAGTGMTSLSELYNNALGTKNLMLDEDIYVTRKTAYYIKDVSGNLVTASKSNVLKMFSRNKKQTETFIKTNKTNFNKDADLQKLLESGLG